MERCSWTIARRHNIVDELAR